MGQACQPAATPETVKAGSNKKFFWQCLHEPTHPHYQASPANRRRSGCPVCAGRAVAPTRNLGVEYPDVARQWHPTKNAEISPENLPPYSNRKVWWLCARGHEWRAVVSMRTGQGTSCPVCCTSQRSGQEVRLYAELATLLGRSAVRHNVRLPGLLPSAGKVDITIEAFAKTVVIEFDGAYWHASRGDVDRRKGMLIRKAGHLLIRVREKPLELLDADDVSVPIGAPVEETATLVLSRMLERGWLGEESTGKARTYIGARRAIGTSLAESLLADVAYRDLGEESLAATHPGLVAEWDYEANGELAPQHVRSDSSKAVGWICPVGDRYKQSPGRRARGHGCPYCANKKVNSRNSLAALHPDLIKEWDEECNLLTPQQVSSGSHKRAYWCCRSCGCRWGTAIKNRTRQKIRPDVHPARRPNDVGSGALIA
ncbi:zinc-ribbon domain-containing protein [Actinomadura luteofluorescens]|uniref:zinc-ribbon domain-containing protein n=1 Tax=Actinomadura luteofluorescens TaxID=46163 RepID=UPI00362D7AE3